MRSSRGSTRSFRWTSTYRAARLDPKRSSTALSSCKRRSPRKGPRKANGDRPSCDRADRDSSGSGHREGAGTLWRPDTRISGGSRSATFVVERENLRPVAAFLRDTAGLEFVRLADLCGADFLDVE